MLFSDLPARISFAEILRSVMVFELGPDHVDGVLSGTLPGQLIEIQAVLSHLGQDWAGRPGLGLFGFHYHQLAPSWLNLSVTILFIKHYL